MKAFVKAATAKLSKAFLRFLNDRDCNLVIRFILHHPIVQNEASLMLRGFFLLPSPACSLDTSGQKE